MTTFQLVKSMMRPLTVEEQAAVVAYCEANSDMDLVDVAAHFETELAMPVTITAIKRVLFEDVMQKEAARDKRIGNARAERAVVVRDDARQFIEEYGEMMGVRFTEQSSIFAGGDGQRYATALIAAAVVTRTWARDLHRQAVKATHEAGVSAHSSRGCCIAVQQIMAATRMKKA